MSPLDESKYEESGCRLRLITGKGAHRRSAESGIIHAKSLDGLLTWSYTTFLTRTHQHPEILVAGLDPFLSQSILRQLSDQISHSTIYTRRSSVSDLLPHLQCVFRDIAPLAAARLIHGLGTSSALQLVYPDPHNLLPWQTGHSASWRQAQPLFLANCAMSLIEERFLAAALDRPLPTERRSNATVRTHLVKTR